MDAVPPVRSPDPDVSPKTSTPSQAPGDNQPDYFPHEANTICGSNTSVKTSEGEGDILGDASSGRKSSVSFVAELPIRPGKEGAECSDAQAEPFEQLVTRKSSNASVTFRQPRNPSLPQGHQKSADASRLRDRSPTHQRFQHHVAFDNVPNGEATKSNTPSLTLNVRHKGYQARRRSRTFMVGVDEHAYSDYAVQWLLDELVDDGDEVVCVRVIEKEIRLNDKQYQEDAQNVMQAVLAKNGSNRAISFILEYSVGKLHTTFQKLILMYEPAMLIVGTRGRSLGGLQGLMNTRNSFSKYCLQYSPVPVVVVRPTEKRIKKKAKRANDATRQTYIGMLTATHGKHEADSEASSMYELEVKISPDEEAHQVAKVLGLPARFDPTIKPLNSSHLPRPRSPGLAPRQAAESPESQRTVNAGSAASAAGDSDEDEEEEEDGEFDVVSGQQALEEQKKQEQLHKMEAGEAAALLKRRVDDEDEDDDEDEGNDQKGA